MQRQLCAQLRALAVLVASEFAPPRKIRRRPAQQPRAIVERTRMATLETGRGFAQRRQRVDERAQRIVERSERIEYAGFLHRAPAGAARRQRFHRRAQFARGLFQRARRALEHRERTGGGLAFGDGVARHFHQRPRAEAFAEELRGEFRQLVRFIDHEHLRAGKDFAETLLFQRQIGEQQMMIDDHHISGLRALACLHHEALVPERAFAAEAVVGGRSDQRQQRRILGQRVEFGQIAHSRAPAPGDDALELGDLFLAREAGLALAFFQPVFAQIVRAALQQRGLDADAQRIAYPRQIAVIQLILQRAGAGRDDGLQSRQQRRNQIRERLAGAGAGLGQQHVAVFDGFGDRHRQLLLRRARREAGNFHGEHAAVAQRVAAGAGQRGARVQRSVVFVRIAAAADIGSHVHRLSTAVGR